MDHCCTLLGLPGGAVVKKSSADTGHTGLIPGLGRYPAVGNGNPLQYSCLENPIDRGVWWVTVHGVTESDMTEHTCTVICILTSPFFQSPWKIL